jgi:hypothetical protein
MDSAGERPARDIDPHTTNHTLKPWDISTGSRKGTFLLALDIIETRHVERQ